MKEVFGEFGFAVVYLVLASGFVALMVEFMSHL